MKLFFMEFILVTILSCVCFSQALKDTTVDIYWRQYTGTVPKDAILGGYDINNKTTYIGQAFLKDYGMIVGMIYPGEKQMTVEMGGVGTANSYLMILCSMHPGSFKWTLATSQNFHIKMLDKYPVRGGYEGSYVLNIGRIAFMGELIVGKIITAAPDRPGETPMFFISNNSGHRSNSYEALIYVPQEESNVSSQKDNNLLHVD